MYRIALGTVGMLMLLAVLVTPGFVMAQTPTPSITVSPETTPPGGTITVTGMGFSAGTTVDMFTLTSVGVQLKLAEITIDTGGTFESQFRLPTPFPPGALPVTITSRPDGTELASATLTVTSDPPVATERMSISPESGPPGTRFEATGSGFAPGMTVVAITLPTATGPQTPQDRIVQHGTFEVGADGSISIAIDSTGFLPESYSLIIRTQSQMFGFPLVRPPVYDITAPGMPDTGAGGTIDQSPGQTWLLLVGALGLAATGVAYGVRHQRQAHHRH